MAIGTWCPVPVQKSLCRFPDLIHQAVGVNEEVIVAILVGDEAVAFFRC